MNVVDAVFSQGVFKPLGNVTLAENQRVRLTVEPAEQSSSQDWLKSVVEFQRRIMAQTGHLPDSTPIIAADRRRHE